MNSSGGMSQSSYRLPISFEWLIPLAPADQDVVGGGLEGEAEAEQALEGGGGRPAAIGAEDELVEIRLQVLRPQAVIDPERPPLRVREHPMDPGQDQVGRDIADHLRFVLD